MTRPKKILLLILILSGLGLLAWLVALPPVLGVSGAITLPDGSWVHLEAVTYGTNHLVGPPLAHIASRLPQLPQNLTRRYLGPWAGMRFSYVTSSPTLVLWLNRGVSAKQFPTNLGYFECVLSSKNGTPGGNPIHYAARYPLETKEFAVFPRREREISLTIYYHDATGAVLNRGSLVFPNPEYRRYSNWKPEALPATKQAGDVAVTLEKVFAGLYEQVEFENSPHGHRLVFTTNAPPPTGTTVCDLRLNPANTNELWQAVGVATSDATGNRVAHQTFAVDNETGRIAFTPALWPDESAWKLNFDIIQTTGFTPGALLTFRDVPFGGLNVTNRMAGTTNGNGVQITLAETVRRESDFELRLTVAGLTNNVRLDLISAITDTGSELVRYIQSDAGTNQIYRFQSPPTEAKHVNFTFAAQHCRRVEFLVKPEKTTARFEIAPPK